MKSTETGDVQVRGGPCVGQGVFGILGWRRGTPRWTDDPVWRQGVHVWMGRRGRRGLPPWTDIGRQEEGAGRVQK